MKPDIANAHSPAGEIGQLAGRLAEGRISPTERLSIFKKIVEGGAIKSLEPLLPLVLNLKGSPYTLTDHFPFQPLFRTDMPQNIVITAGRQTGKSASLSAESIMVANSIPHFSILFVTPLYEQIRRLSNNYIRAFIEESPVKSLWSGTSTENSVLQRSFKNYSKLFFSFALLDANRIRGLSCDRCNFDEVQDMDPDHIPIIREVMSHSKWGITWYTGTPNTEENIIEGLRRRSSMAEWFIRCQACGHWNIPSKEYDILEMIGPLRDDISDSQPAVVCAKCRRPIDPRTGRWVHRHEGLRQDFAGYHIPQIIMPVHYADRKKWAELLGKQRGVGNTTKAMFYNEVLGESYDQATKLLSVADLKSAATLPWSNRPDSPEAASSHTHEYAYRCLAVDWGGGGKKETSFTTLAVLGWRPGGVIDVIWGKRSLSPHDHIGEAEECLRIFNMFQCNFLVHDYTGAGSLRETFINQAGVPLSRIIPISYVRTARRDLMSLHAATRQNPRDYHMLDKARSLQLTCSCIKLGRVRFFQYDFVNDDDPGLLHDFLALIENKVGTAHGGDLYTIVRNEMFKDDFAQAVNIGCCALWYATSSWPDIAELAQLKSDAGSADGLGPPPDKTWKE